MPCPSKNSQWGSGSPWSRRPSSCSTSPALLVTGKSFWLNGVRKRTSHLFPGCSFVKTAAPSGTAAFLIGGETLHSLFKLPVGHTPFTDLKSGSRSCRRRSATPWYQESHVRPRLGGWVTQKCVRVATFYG